MHILLNYVRQLNVRNIYCLCNIHGIFHLFILSINLINRSKISKFVTIFLPCLSAIFVGNQDTFVQIQTSHCRKGDNHTVLSTHYLYRRGPHQETAFVHMTTSNRMLLTFKSSTRKYFHHASHVEEYYLMYICI